VTVVCTSAGSYLNSSAREAGAAAEFAASRKTAKYASLAASYIFFPIAVETQGLRVLVRVRVRVRVKVKVKVKVRDTLYMHTLHNEV